MAEPECSSVKRWKGLEGSGSAKTSPSVRQSCSLENTCRTEVGSVRGPWGGCLIGHLVYRSGQDREIQNPMSKKTYKSEKGKYLIRGLRRLEFPEEADVVPSKGL